MEGKEETEGGERMEERDVTKATFGHELRRHLSLSDEAF